MLNLAGTVTYTGGTTVEMGALIVSGSLPGSLTVLPGALVEFNGNSGSTTVEGTLAPGHSIGTMTIEGDLTFGEDSVYEVEVSPSAADRTNVTGLATLNGAVRIIAEPGDYTPEVLYTILSAGSLSGTFTEFTSDLASYTFIAPTLTYDANNVYFSLARIATFASVGETRTRSRPARPWIRSVTAIRSFRASSTAPRIRLASRSKRFRARFMRARSARWPTRRATCAMRC